MLPNLSPWGRDAQRLCVPASDMGLSSLCEAWCTAGPSCPGGMAPRLSGQSPGDKQFVPASGPRRQQPRPAETRPGEGPPCTA